MNTPTTDRVKEEEHNDSAFETSTYGTTINALIQYYR